MTCSGNALEFGDHRVDPAGLGDEGNHGAAARGERRLDRPAGFVGAGEGDARYSLILDEGGTDLAATRQQLQCPGRHPRLVQKLGGEEGNDRRLLGRLGKHGIARRQRGRHLPGKDRQWKIPRADAGERAAPPQRQQIALPRHPRQRHRRREEPPGFVGVVAQKVDGLAHVAQGVLERLAGLAHDNGYQLRAVALIKLGGAFQDLSPRRPARQVPSRRGALGAGDGGLDRGLVGGLDRADALAPIVGAQHDQGFAAIGDLARDDCCRRVGRRQHRLELPIKRGARRRLVKRHAPTIETRGGKNLGRARHQQHLPIALALRRLDRIGNHGVDRQGVVGQAIDERGVGAVLQQPTHQIGHEVCVGADRGIDAAGQAAPVAAQHFLVKRLAHAMQSLKLERPVAGGDRDARHRLRIVRGELREKGAGIRQQQAHCGEIGYIGGELARQHRVVGEPPLLRPLDLAVPIGAFDQTHRDALAPLIGEAAQPAQHGNGTLTVGLHGDAETGPALQGGVGERGGELVECQIEPILFLSVDGQGEIVSACGPGQFDETRQQFPSETILLSRIEARMNRRQLDREAWAIEQRAAVPGARSRRLADRLHGADIAIEVARRVVRRARPLAQHIIGKPVALGLQGGRARQRFLDRAAEHEIVGQDAHGLPHRLADERLAGTRQQALQDAGRT